MGIYRTALLVAVAQSNMEKNQNHTWTTLTSGSTSNQDYYINTNYYNYTPYSDRGYRSDLYEFHGNANVFFGGAMLVVISTIVCLICYCCHRKSKMRSSLYMQHHRWFDSDYNMEVYSVEQYYDMNASMHEDEFAMRNVNERPPSYECIMALNEALIRSQKMTSNELPGVELLDNKRNVAIDMNGNIPQSIIQCEITDRLNNNSEHPTTSSSTTNQNDDAKESEINGNVDCNEDWDMSRANGIVKLDMSKIMDHTGLPTYEAALTLKSSNYI